MKLVFEKSDLVKSVTIVLKAVSVRTTMNILECILIDASANEILFTGNDMDLAIQTKVAGSIEEKGKVAIDARIFSDLVKKLPDGKIRIETNEKNICTVSYGNKKYEIPGMAAEEFTHIPEVEKSNSISMSQFSLREIINQTIFSISMNDINPMMTGELFEIKDGLLRVIGLDSHRISLRNFKIDDTEKKVYVVIPGKSLKEIAGILVPDEEKNVNIYFSEKHVLFEIENTKIVSRLLEGNYFNVNQMFSTDYETKIKINKNDFTEAIDRDMVFIKESDKRPVILDIKDGEMKIAVKSTLGQGEETVDIQKEGADLKIGFNPKFLMDALKVIEDEEVTLSFVNSKSPCFIKDDEDTYLYLILPVNFSEE